MESYTITNIDAGSFTEKTITFAKNYDYVIAATSASNNQAWAIYTGSGSRIHFVSKDSSDNTASSRLIILKDVKQGDTLNVRWFNIVVGFSK